jgi:hypothetical protein
VAIFYDGAKARELDAPLERAAAKKSGDRDYDRRARQPPAIFIATLCLFPPNRKRRSFTWIPSA